MAIRNWSRRTLPNSTVSSADMAAGVRKGRAMPARSAPGALALAESMPVRRPPPAKRHLRVGTCLYHVNVAAALVYSVGVIQLDRAHVGEEEDVGGHFAHSISGFQFRVLQGRSL